MMWKAKNESIETEGYRTDYISFGSGEKNLIFIPGVGDGMKTVKGTAVLFAFMYRMFAKKYKVYVFSRKNGLPEKYSTREMAADLHNNMQKLGIAKADIIGVSMGGMIAQYLAVDYPECVGKLVLAVTLARCNDTLKQVGNAWIRMAEAGDYKGLMLDTAEKSYTDDYLRRNRFLLRLSTKVGKPKDFRRFITMTNACMSHNVYEELSGITCQTLVIGGKQDKIVTGEASLEMAGRIPTSQCKIYEEFGHALYEEAADFISVIMDFLEE